MLGGFVDSLLQTFENCRAGLTDAQLAAGGREVEEFFRGLYEQEKPRLRETILQQETHLSPANRRQLLSRVDELIRKVVVPAYIRLATPFSRRERNDFYLTLGDFHFLERGAWGAAGVAVGIFVVWAPFIPLWSKEWVLVFAVGGLVFPDLRRFLTLRRYQGELNRLVIRTDAEIWRTDLEYLTVGEALAAAAAPEEAPEAPGSVADRLTEPEKKTEERPPRPKPIAREGGH